MKLLKGVFGIKKKDKAAIDSPVKFAIVSPSTTDIAKDANSTSPSPPATTTTNAVFPQITPSANASIAPLAIISTPSSSPTSSPFESIAYTDPIHPPTAPSNPQFASPSLTATASTSPRPSETIRGPHAIQTDAEHAALVNETVMDADEATVVALQRSGTLPPAYNSLNIQNHYHMATAPSPESLSVAVPATVVPEAPVSVMSMPYGSSSSAPAMNAYMNPPLPPHPVVVQPYATMQPVPTMAPAQAMPPAQAMSMHQQPYPQPQPQPIYAAGPWPPTQPAYPPPVSSAGSQTYGHRPFVLPGSENQTYPIIMAIDWGTTYSSMAYAFQQDGEVHEVSTWPKQTHSYPKVPTCNLYGPNSKEILEWGYPAKLALSKPPFKNHVLLSKYKLHLDDSSGPHPPLPNGLTVVDAIADYLRLFHAHVLQSVLKGFGASYEQRHIQYCLSVPAMWSDTAKAVMRQAALQAGMISPLDPPHRLLLISEPEAAALYCEKKCDQFSIGHGQRFMICDAGGGTVDLIVFEVAVGPNGRTLREVTRGSGHSCGSVFLDERMEALLRRRMSKWQEKGPTPTNWAQIMDHFIHSVKPLFDGLEDQYIPLPAIPGRSDLTDYDIGLEDGVLTIKAEEMRRDVFDPVVDDVLRLIQHQLQQTRFNCHAIFMVGGFGCSNYLHQRVTAEFGSQVPLIGVPPRAELAVVRGAVYAGLTPRMVTQRVARRWYGVDSLMSYEEGSDMPHKKVRDREGVIRARDRFSVYVAPGQTIGMDECITKRYITYQYPKPVNSPLYACSYMTLPRYVDSPSVEKIGDFTIPLPYVPGAQPGHKMVFELRMYFGLTEIRAEAEINGKVVSTRCQFSG